MPDDFNKTISNVTNYIPKFEQDVKRAGRVEDRRVENRTDAKERQGDKHRYPFSEIKPPDAQLWNEILEALEIFNQHQDVRNSPFVIRLWAQNNGFRIQLIHETTGDLIKQSKLIQFDKVTTADLNVIINELVAERGVVIDITR
ncbi:MAG: hypothetical protein WCX65_02650 [bacterium]